MALYLPEPEPMVDEKPLRHAVRRPWLRFFQDVIDALTGNAASITQIESDISTIQTQIGSIITQIVALEAWGVWQAWAAVLTAVTTNPTNVTLVYGRYVEIGKTVIAQAQFTMAAGFTGGTGGYTITIPAPAVNLSNASVAGSVMVRRGADGLIWGGTLKISAVSGIVMITDTGAALPMDNATPIAFVAGDKLSVTLVYERT